MVDRGDGTGPTTEWSSTNPVHDDEQSNLSAWRTIPSGAEAEQEEGGLSRIRKQNSTAEATEGLPRRLQRVIEQEDDIGSRPLSVAGAKLDKKFVTSSNHAMTWDESVTQWENWVKEYDDLQMKIEDNQGNQQEIDLKMRFSPERAKKDYARLQNLHEGLEAEYGEALHCAFLSLTASSRNERGGWRCPVDMLNDLNEGLNACMQALRRALDGREWCYAHIIEPHKTGYPHRHIAVFVRGPIRESDFHSVIDSHLANCPSAGPDAHEYEDCIRVERVGGRDGEISNLAYYLSEYITDSFENDDPLDAPEHVKRLNTVLTAANANRLQFSDHACDIAEIGFEEYTGETPTDSEDSDYSLVGVSFDGGDSYLEPDEEDVNNGSRMIESRTVMPDKLDPEKEISKPPD